MAAVTISVDCGENSVQFSRKRTWQSCCHKHAISFLSVLVLLPPFNSIHLASFLQGTGFFDANVSNSQCRDPIPVTPLTSGVKKARLTEAQGGQIVSFQALWYAPRRASQQQKPGKVKHFPRYLNLSSLWTVVYISEWKKITPLFLTAEGVLVISYVTSLVWCMCGFCHGPRPPGAKVAMISCSKSFDSKLIGLESDKKEEGKKEQMCFFFPLEHYFFLNPPWKPKKNMFWLYLQIYLIILECWTPFYLWKGTSITRL